jgi:hypothetical protein
MPLSTKIRRQPSSRIVRQDCELESRARKGLFRDSVARLSIRICARQDAHIIFDKTYRQVRIQDFFRLLILF